MNSSISLFSRLPDLMYGNHYVNEFLFNFGRRGCVSLLIRTQLHTSASSLRDLGKMSKNTATSGNTLLTGDISDLG